MQTVVTPNRFTLLREINYEVCHLCLANWVFLKRKKQRLLWSLIVMANQDLI